MPLITIFTGPIQEIVTKLTTLCFEKIAQIATLNQYVSPAKKAKSLSAKSQERPEIYDDFQSEL